MCLYKFSLVHLLVTWLFLSLILNMNDLVASHQENLFRINQIQNGGDWNSGHALLKMIVKLRLCIFLILFLFVYAHNLLSCCIPYFSIKNKSRFLKNIYAIEWKEQVKVIWCRNPG